MSKARELAELGAVYDSGALSNRNFVINGAMQVFQRGTSFTNSALAYNADLIAVDDNQGGGGQSTDAPDGFTYSLKVDPGSGLNAAIRHPIELPAAGEGGVFRSGQKFTLSFYLKSDNAGEAINIFVASSTTKGGTTTNHVNNTSTGLTTTTSWTRYTYTFTSNNVGGSDTCYNLVPYVTTPSGAVYWTGLQLELGTEATPFEHMSYGDVLKKCQRYYHRIEGAAKLIGHCFYFGTTEVDVEVNLPCSMRVAPTLTASTVSNNFRIQHYSDDFNTFSGVQYYSGASLNMWAQSGGSVGTISGTAGDAGYVVTNQTTSVVEFGSEF